MLFLMNEYTEKSFTQIRENISCILLIYHFQLIGLCGQFNFKDDDEFYAPHSIPGGSVASFVNHYRDQTCEEVDDYENFCKLMPSLVCMLLQKIETG